MDERAVLPSRLRGRGKDYELILKKKIAISQKGLVDLEKAMIFSFNGKDFGNSKSKL